MEEFKRSIVEEIDELRALMSDEAQLGIVDNSTVDNRILAFDEPISEADFRLWLSKRTKRDGQPLSDEYQNAYYYILKALPSMLGCENVFEITSFDEFEIFRKAIADSDKYKEANPNIGSGTLSGALTQYGNYLAERNLISISTERLAEILKEWYAKKYVENNITSTLVGFGFKYARSINRSNISSNALLELAQIESTMSAYIDRGKDLYAAIEKSSIGITVNSVSSCPIEVFDYSITKGKGINKIFYGTPGCGKSYYIEHEILEKENYAKENVIRTTFYQDYSNTDFVGQILPKIVRGKNGEKDTVEYIFNPGPFTLALIQAISNPTEKVALVVEEINRGNAPAIFGDIFQLLDRDDDRISEYGIVNVGVMDYLNNYTFTVDGKEKKYIFSDIKIPGNMYIYATMNTSDQNVYTLDTAFVRRWGKEKIQNSFEKCTFRKVSIPGMSNYTWEEFVVGINNCIASHLEDLQVNEDKQIGAYFVKEKFLNESTPEEFAYKVFDYLWSDVAKLDHAILFRPFDTLDKLIAAYKNEGVKVFQGGIFAEKSNAQQPVNEPKQEDDSDE